MSREQVVDYLDTKNPKDVLCLGARTGVYGQGPE